MYHASEGTQSFCDSSCGFLYKIGGYDFGLLLVNRKFDWLALIRASHVEVRLKSQLFVG